MNSDGGKRDLEKMPACLAAGFKAAWPICIGYAPIGLAFGVLAQKAGLKPAEIGLMSLLVFAGSSQFIAVSLLNTGAGFLSIVATTFMINLRHLLMSSSLALYTKSARRSFLSLFAYGITDESFAVNVARFRDGNWGWCEALTVNHLANSAWVVSTIAGGYGGEFIDPGSFGIDYALIAMFVCLIAFQLRGKIYWLTGFLAGFLAVVLAVFMPGNLYIVLASILAATLGLFLKRLVPSLRESG